MIPDINQLIILIIGDKPENTEFIERNINFTRHIQYYRKLAFSQKIILSYMIDIDDFETPNMLASQGFCVFLNYQLKEKFNKERQECLIYFPENMNEFQLELLKSKQNEFAQFHSIHCAKYQKELGRCTDMHVDFYEYLEEETLKLKPSKKLSSR